MKNSLFIKKIHWENQFRFICVFCLVFFTGCAETFKHKVQRSSKMDIQGIHKVSIGKFENILGKEISLPKPLKGNKYENKGTLTPYTLRFIANEKTADLVRAVFVAGLFESGQYEIVNTSSIDLPDQYRTQDTGIIKAKIKYFEMIRNAGEKKKFTLEATKNFWLIFWMSDEKQLSTTVPYTEIVSAIQVEFHFVRALGNTNIIPPKTLTGYYTRKWGLVEDTSILPKSLKETIRSRYQSDEELKSELSKLVGKTVLSFEDPNEFLAKGGNLKQNPVIPKTALDIKTRLIQNVTERYLRFISRYEEETALEIAEGNMSGKLLLAGGAFQHAINYLESLSDRNPQDHYNLGLAYEAIGEVHQAIGYYQEALKEEPSNILYKAAVARTRK